MLFALEILNLLKMLNTICFGILLSTINISLNRHNHGKK